MLLHTVTYTMNADSNQHHTSNMPRSNRIRWIDIGKGVGIVLVSFGHIRNGNGESVWLPALNTPINFIYLFHMPLFFFLGGLTFSSRRAFPVFLKIKAKTLLIPYYVFSLYFLAKPITALVRPDLVSQMQAHQDYTANMWRQFYNVLVGGQGLWFLWAYFIGELIVYPLHRKYKAAWQYTTTGLVFIIANTLFTYYFSQISIPFCIVSGIKVAGFMLLGIASKQWLLSMTRTPALGMFAVTTASFIAMAMLADTIASPFLKGTSNFLAMFLGVAATVFLSISLIHNSILEHIGRYSLSFYVVNALTLNIGKILFFRILHINGQHANTAMQWLYGIALTIFCLALLWIEDLLIRKLIPWSVGMKRQKQLSTESDAM